MAKLTIHDKLYNNGPLIHSAVHWLYRNRDLVKAMKWGHDYQWGWENIHAATLEWCSISDAYPFFDMVLEGPDEEIVEFRMRFL